MSAARLLRLACAALAVGSLACAALLAPGCLDLTPVVLPAKDAGVLDDASCTICLETPSDQQGCLDVLDACRQNEGCAPVLACIQALDCFDRPILDEKLNCGVPCLQEAGITTVDDPRVKALLDVVKCGQNECGVACSFGDGGLAFDAL